MTVLHYYCWSFLTFFMQCNHFFTCVRRMSDIYLNRGDIKLKGNERNFNRLIFMTVLHYYCWSFLTVFVLCNNILFVWSVVQQGRVS